MKAAKIISSLLTLMIVAPIWYYLLYWLLKHSGAGDLQIFLFWIYLPVAVFLKFLDWVIQTSEPKK
jgi:uncharacterized membrane protein YvlD (DUF360 family)